MNQTVFLLGAATLALGGTSAYLWKEVRDERARNVSVQAQVAEFEARLNGMPPAIEPPPPPPVSAEIPPPPKAPPPRPAPSRQAAAEPESTFGLNPGSGAMVYSGDPRRMFQDPEYRALRLEQNKMMLRRQYSDLGVALNLPEDEIEKLIGVLAEHQLQMMAEGPFMRPGSDPAAEWSRKLAEIQREKEADVKALLGDAKYQEWLDYKNSMGTRMQVRNLRSALEGSSDPLREDQYQALVTAMTEEQRRLGAEPRSDLLKPSSSSMVSQSEQLTAVEQSLERAAQYNQRMRDAAAPYLSSTQLQRFDQMLKQGLEMQRLNLKMMQSRGSNPGMQMEMSSDGTTVTISRSTPGGAIGQTVIATEAAPPAPP